MTKTSMMLGLGETEEEIMATFQELIAAKVDLLTLGQYLSPGPGYHPVVSFPEPGSFDRLANIAKENGHYIYKEFFNLDCAKKIVSTFGNAKLVIAVPDDWIDVQTIADLEEVSFDIRSKRNSRLRVATKYPNLTNNFLSGRYSS